ncbi:hypothetical protein [Tolypothrix sp. NIES-4075]|uniref:hypothetical protein n=1 Tax=Tolypothrix sp. NIES-4075 TaxID=2005459 RepID=UPI000B5C97C3|nr:hypothetical protein [Tolypothrix sp. NIES-4075]
MVKRVRAKGRKTTNAYHYTPTPRLVSRLAFELKMTEKLVRKQILEERLYLLKEVWNDPTITAADV